MNFALSTVFTTISVLLIWVFGPIALTPISYFAVQHAFKCEYKERKYVINGVTAQGAAMVASLVLGYVVFAVFPRELLIQLMNQLHSAQIFNLGISRALLERDNLPAAPAELVRLNVLYWSSVFALTVLLFYIFVNFGTFQRRLQNLLANMIKNKGNGTPLFLSETSL